MHKLTHHARSGVASAAIRCISIGAESLTDFREQVEILTILKKIKKETGWRIDFLEPELRKKWRWTEDHVRHQISLLTAAEYAAGPYAQMLAAYGPAPVAVPGALPGSSPPTLPAIPRGVVNPTMRMADFSAPQHAYQNHWVAPTPGHNESHYLYRLTDNHYIG